MENNRNCMTCTYRRIDALEEPCNTCLMSPDPTFRYYTASPSLVMHKVTEKVMKYFNHGLQEGLNSVSDYTTHELLTETLNMRKGQENMINIVERNAFRIMLESYCAKRNLLLSMDLDGPAETGITFREKSTYKSLYYIIKWDECKSVYEALRVITKFTDDKFGFGKDKALRKKIEPERVIYQNPATIVFWSDGSKTVVKADNDEYDPEKGLAMAYVKKFEGNQGNYYNFFRKWLPKDRKEFPLCTKKAVRLKICAEKAYKALTSTHKSKINKTELTAAIEEAVGWLGHGLK